MADVCEYVSLHRRKVILIILREKKKKGKRRMEVRIFFPCVRCVADDSDDFTRNSAIHYKLAKRRHDSSPDVFIFSIKSKECASEREKGRVKKNIMQIGSIPMEKYQQKVNLEWTLNENEKKKKKN